MKKFFESYGIFWLSFTIAAIIMILFIPAPAHALGGNGNRLIYEERAVIYQQLNLEAANAQGKLLIAQAQDFCASLGTSLDPSKVKLRANSDVRNRIRSRDRYRGRGNTIHLDLNRVIFGQARPSGDYNNTANYSVTIASNPCLVKK